MIGGHFRLDDAVDRRLGGVVGAGDLPQTLSMLAIANDCSVVEIESPASDVPAFEAGAPHPGADPLDDQVALEFSDGADDYDDSAA
jgi:hypothetical protein